MQTYKLALLRKMVSTGEDMTIHLALTDDTLCFVEAEQWCKFFL